MMENDKCMETPIKSNGRGVTTEERDDYILISVVIIMLLLLARGTMGSISELNFYKFDYNYRASAI